MNGQRDTIDTARRRFFGLTLGAAWFSAAAARTFGAGTQHTAHAPAPGGAKARTADQALAELTAGNARFQKARMQHGHQDLGWWHGLSQSQHPFAVVVSCSDSRVAPEIVFDQGLGDLFVIRNAGHVPDDATIASAEYAVAHLGVPLVVVLGHERCGAVQATVDAMKSGAAPEGHIARLVDAIRPAVASVQGKSGDTVDLAVRANVQLAVTALATSTPVLAPAVGAGTLKVVGARYDLDTGEVEMLGPTS